MRREITSRLNGLAEREFRNSPDFPGVWQDAGACVAGEFGVAEPWVQKVASRLRHTRAPWVMRGRSRVLWVGWVRSTVAGGASPQP
jgi:hypothetical protein